MDTVIGVNAVLVHVERTRTQRIAGSSIDAAGIARQRGATTIAITAVLSLMKTRKDAQAVE